MLTHDHDNFPSDIFTIMEAAGATVTIGQSVCVCVCVCVVHYFVCIIKLQPMLVELVSILCGTF